MILVDTSVWVDHLHRGDAAMQWLLETGAVRMHPFVLGELALGSLRDRKAVLAELRMLPAASPTSGDDVLELIERRDLHGSGIGLVDAHLIASTLLDPEDLLWTRDRRLARVAERLGISAASD